MPDTGEGVEPDTDTPIVSNTDKPNTDDVRKIKAENARMAKALADLQTKTKDLENFKKRADDEKLTAEERAKAEAAELKKALDAKQIEIAEAKTELEQERLVNKLIVADLDDPDFGPLLLRNFDADAETFDEFVARMKASKKFSRFFKPGGDAQTENRGPAPAAPRSGSQRVNKAGDEVSEADRRLAEQRYPNDPNKQKALIKNLAEAKRIRQQQEADYGRIS
jgi:hypothetical protein